MKTVIQKSAQETVNVVGQLSQTVGLLFLEEAARALVRCFERGCKVLIAGNGGSLADAMHFAEELTGYFRVKRPALPAIALADPTHMSCVANDMGFEMVFARAVDALGTPGDLLVVLTTSGNSLNLVRAVDSAKAKGMETLAFLGRGGGRLQGLCDYEWIVQGATTSDRIQEAHMSAIHIIIEAVECALYQGPHDVH